MADDQPLGLRIEVTRRGALRWWWRVLHPVEDLAFCQGPARTRRSAQREARGFVARVHRQWVAWYGDSEVTSRGA